MENLSFDRKGAKVEKELVAHPTLLDKGDNWELWHLATHAKHSYDVQRYNINSEVEAFPEEKCLVLNLVEGESAEVVTERGQQFYLNYAETLVVSAGLDST